MKLETFSSRVDAVEAARDAVAAEIGTGANLYISGGSSFAVFEALDKTLENPNAVHLYLIDERYGEVGHADSNWNLLKDIDTDRYWSAEPTLIEGQSLKDTQATVNVRFQGVLEEQDRLVGILGLGPDHHVAGIKPMEADAFHNTFHHLEVAAYEWSDYQRVTLTLEALEQFDALVVFAAGEEKREVIESLDAELPAHESPIHGLLNHPNITIIYSEE